MSGLWWDTVQDGKPYVPEWVRVPPIEPIAVQRARERHRDVVMFLAGVAVVLLIIMLSNW